MHACIYVCIRRWWHRGKVPGRRSVEHELWKTRHSHSHRQTPWLWPRHLQVFPKMSNNHTVQKHTGVAKIHISVSSPGICIRFFPHWVKALAPDVIDCLTHCRAVSPPSKKLTGGAPAPVAKTQRCHACYLVTTWQLQYLGTAWTRRTDLFYIA